MADNILKLHDSIIREESDESTSHHSSIILKDEESQIDYIDIESTTGDYTAIKPTTRINALEILNSKKTKKHVKQVILKWCTELFNDLSNDSVFETTHKYHTRLDNIYTRIKTSTVKASHFMLMKQSITDAPSPINKKYTNRDIVSSETFFCEKIKSGTFAGLWLVFINIVKVRDDGSRYYDGYYSYLSLKKQYPHGGCTIL